MAGAAMAEFKLSKMLPRAIKLFKDPKGFWQEMATERGGIGAVMPSVIVFVAASGVAGFIGTLLGVLMNSILRPFFGRMIVAGLLGLVVGVALGVGVWFVFAILIKAFAKTFDASDEMEGASKVAFGSLLPMWIAGLLQLIPFGFMTWIATLGGLGYGCFMCYLGVQEIMAAPKEKAIGYTAATMGITFVIVLVGGSILGVISACFVGGAILAG
ncbi:MAG: hypothetical protein CSA24_02325 [Deltaproteobacteria bacterium]|nr:MAG: hypothetical protein CSB49_05515 [Pseudomonadota bacterium]PIE65633.1 MAG: hypothetical protein CSA24_02325 [Deltaproteobacteria bacterium]